MKKSEETRLRNLLSKREAICLDHNEMIMLKRLQELKNAEGVMRPEPSKRNQVSAQPAKDKGNALRGSRV